MERISRYIVNLNHDLNHANIQLEEKQFHILDDNNDNDNANEPIIHDPALAYFSASQKIHIHIFLYTKKMGFDILIWSVIDKNLDIFYVSLCWNIQGNQFLARN